jgi:hypothetical protein
MTTATNETITDPKAKELWDAVLEAVYSAEPEEGVECEWEECSHAWEDCDQDCVCEGDPLVASFHYLRDDNGDTITERISAAFEYSKDLSFSALPELVEDEASSDFRGYVNAVEDIDTAELVEAELIEEVSEWMEEWVAHSLESAAE